MLPSKRSVASDSSLKMQNLVVLLIGVVVVGLIYWFARRARAGKSPELSQRSGDTWARFASPTGGFSLDYPGDWLTREQINGPISQDSSFVAVDPTGETLFEVFSLVPKPLPFYVAVTERDQKADHHDTTIIASTPFTLESAKECLRITLTYTEPTIRGTEESFTSDYYLINTGSAVLSLNFKVLSAKYQRLRATFETVARKVRLR